MSGPLDVNRIKVAGGARSSAMPDKQISLDIHLPHGKQLTMQFRRDLTVAYVKLQLSGRCGVSVAELELDGQLMADPLSLSDFPSLAAAGSGAVRAVVEGDAEGQVEGEEEKQQTEEEARRDARDLDSLNDEDLADDLQHAARIR